MLPPRAPGWRLGPSCGGWQPPAPSLGPRPSDGAGCPQRSSVPRKPSLRWGWRQGPAGSSPGARPSPCGTQGAPLSPFLCKLLEIPPGDRPGRNHGAAGCRYSTSRRAGQPLLPAGDGQENGDILRSGTHWSGAGSGSHRPGCDVPSSALWGCSPWDWPHGGLPSPLAWRRHGSPSLAPGGGRGGSRQRRYTAGHDPASWADPFCSGTRRFPCSSSFPISFVLGIN